MSTLKNLPPVQQQQAQHELDASLVSNDQNDALEQQQQYHSSGGTTDYGYANYNSIAKFNGSLPTSTTNKKRVSYDQSIDAYGNEEERRPSRRLSSIALRKNSKLSRRGSRKISIIVDEDVVVPKDWSEYTSAEKISFVFFTIIKVFYIHQGVY